MRMEEPAWAPLGKGQAACPVHPGASQARGPRSGPGPAVVSGSRVASEVLQSIRGQGIYESGKCRASSGLDPESGSRQSGRNVVRER